MFPEAYLEMPKKIFKKNQDFGITDVLRPVETNVKTDSFSFGRNADSGNSRYLRPSSGDFKDGSFTFGRLGSSDGGDKTKPAFIEEYHRNFKRFRLFLYAAKHDVSTVLFSPHSVLWPFLAAPANLCQEPPEIVRMIRHPEAFSDHFGNPSTRPKIGGVSFLQRSFPKNLCQRTFLARFHFCRAPTDGF